MDMYGIFKAFWKNVEKSDNKLHATQVLPSGIKEINNIAYTGDGNTYHLLDFYCPESNDGKLPVIIDVHGGGWMYGDKELNKIYCEYLAARGFAVFNISYRLVPETDVKGQLSDVSLALKWIKENLSSFPVDESKIMLTGDSAGGFLAAFTSVISASEKLRDIFGTADHGLKFSCVTLTSPVAYMNENGAMGFYTRKMWGEGGFLKSGSKFMNIDELLEYTDKLPPMLLVTSSGDILALKQTRRLYRELYLKGVKTEILDMPKFEGKNLPHVFGVLEPYSNAGIIYIDRMERFFRENS
ncbi:MAG: alpha/beta hydrolase [Clostridia bacterium]|nr:alpha/beta hydrolase [Clostridia bacterium]